MKKLNDLSQLASLKSDLEKDEWRGFNPKTTQIDEDEKYFEQHHDPTSSATDPRKLSEHEMSIIEGRNSSY